MKCAKCLMIALNICFLVISVVIISVAATPRFTFGEYFTVLTTDNDIGSLHLTWIGSGFLLMAVGIFGLWSALKESTFMINLYTVIMSFVLTLQIVTATTSNTVSGELDYFVSISLKRLMVQYGYNYESTSIMDSIQKEYKCCGNNGPYDWYLLEQFSTTKKTTNRRTATEPTILDELEAASRDDYMQEILEKSSPNDLSLPTSCCKDKKCKKFHSNGCFNSVYNDFARVVFMVTSVAMFSSLLQICGILVSYIFGRTLRFKKENRATHVQR